MARAENPDKKPTSKLGVVNDTDQHKRFVEAATQAQASDDPKEFDRVFDAVVKKPLDLRFHRK